MKPRLIRFGLASWLAAAAIWVSPGVADGQSGLAEDRASALRDSVAGSWSATVGKHEVVLSLKRDGSYRTGSREGTWSLHPDGLELAPSTGEPVRYAFELQGGILILSGGDLPQPLRYSPGMAEDPPWVEATRWLRQLKPVEWRERLLKVSAILVIVALSIGVIGILRRVSGYVIFSDRGLLRFVGRNRKNQTRTIHMVVLNVITYIILLAALGRILGEFGVNYTAYFASLSVIGLAIGFGSQGLVQDLVTGISIMLDNQFSVGDMVEISGQTGRVEAVGLRTTRIRNYLGQVVVIPNRNIAMIGNFTRGSVAARIDVAMPDKAAADKMRGPLDTLYGELHRQFTETIVLRPAKPEILSLKTGEFFIRTRVDLWPQQQALVDAQIVPRVRECCARQEVEIPAGRIAVTYRVPEAVRESTWKGFRIRRRTPGAAADESPAAKTDR